MATFALIATADPATADDLLRLAAAADVRAEVADDRDRTRAAWGRPSLVLLGADLAPGLVTAGTPRRPGVVLVTRHRDDEEVYRLAVEIGAEEVAILPDAEARLVDVLAAAAEPADGGAVTVCVTGARGGAGASTFAAVLALTGARHGLRTLIVDGDPQGGGLDLLLGHEEAPGARWPEFLEVRGRLSAAALREALPSVGERARPGGHGGELALLSWHRGDADPVPPGAMRAVLDAGARGFDLMVLDVQRHLGDAAVEALVTADLALLVVPAEVRAVAAAARVAGAVGRHTSDVRVIVRGPAPGGLTAQSVAHVLGLPLAGAVTSDRRVAAALEHGDLPAVSRRGALTGLCSGLVAQLAGRTRSGART